MAKTIRLKKTGEYARLPNAEAEELVRKGKARFADKNEWRRYLKKKNDFISSNNS